MANTNTIWHQAISINCHLLATEQEPYKTACCLTPSLPQPAKFPGWKVHAYTPANSLFDGPVTNLLSVQCIWIEFLSRAHVKVWKSQNDFKFGSSIAHFPSDRTASMAVKGLIKNIKQFSGKKFGEWTICLSLCLCWEYIWLNHLFFIH